MIKTGQPNDLPPSWNAPQNGPPGCQSKSKPMKPRDTGSNWGGEDVGPIYNVHGVGDGCGRKGYKKFTRRFNGYT